MRVLVFFIALLFVAFPAIAASNLGARTDPEAIADTGVATGSKGVAEAWLIVPTTIYPHYVRGIPYEPSGLRVRTNDGNILSLKLDENHVFEDRTPRLADLDNDGRDEIVLVLTSLREGSALAAYAIIDNELVLKARTPHIGRAFRWLNPAGIADYDGDGILDVALVQKPHLDKQLEIWTLTAGDFRRIASVRDVSNHRNGSANTGLSASVDFDGDGVTDLAVPSGTRDAVRILSFADRRPREIDVVPLPAPADGNFDIRPVDGGWQLSVPLQTGERHEIIISTP